jgi:hypothetical protein
VPYQRPNSPEPLHRGRGSSPSSDASSGGVSSEFARIEADVLLCDAAQEVGGKLFILGAGWSRVLPQGPLTMAIAVKLKVPWHAANQRLTIRLALLTEDGKPVTESSGNVVAVEGLMEVGRPPGLRPGTALDSALAFTVNALTLDPGHYRWELTIASELLKSITFEVLDAPSPRSPNSPG